MIYRLVYISRSVVAPISDAVAEIARKSLLHNGQVGITGFLYFDKDVFIQEIEGIKDDVEALYARISADPNHTGVRTLLRQDAETRVFGEWSMAFYDGQTADNPVRRAFGDDFFSTIGEADGSELLRVLRELALSNDASGSNPAAPAMNPA